MACAPQVKAWPSAAKRHYGGETDWAALVPRAAAELYLNNSASLLGGAEGGGAAGCMWQHCARAVYNANRLASRHVAAITNERLKLEWLFWNGARVAAFEADERTAVRTERDKVRAAREAGVASAERTLLATERTRTPEFPLPARCAALLAEFGLDARRGASAENMYPRLWW